MKKEANIPLEFIIEVNTLYRKVSKAEVEQLPFFQKKKNGKITVL
ncbi:hypothetical protein [Peribacillus simplex]